MMISCNKSSIDLDVNDRQSIIDNISAYDYVPANKGDIVYIDLGEITTSLYHGIPALLNHKAEENAEVTARIEYDDKLIKIYDEIYNTQSPKLLPGMFKLSNQGILNIKKGDKESLDSLKVEIESTNKFEEMGVKEYVIPVVFESKNSNITLKSKFMFLRFILDTKSYLSAGQQVYEMLGFFPKGVIDNSGYELATAATKDVVFEFEYDLDFVKTYNDKYHTNYVGLAEESITYTKLFSFLKGQKIPKDIISASIKDPSKLDQNKVYISPLKIKTLNGQKLNSSFRIILMFISNRVDDSNTVIVGDLMNRSKWKCIASSNGSTSKTPEKLIDGLNTTVWETLNIRPNMLIVDFGESVSTKGFRITPNYTLRTRDFIGSDIYGSNDRVKWDVIGRYSGTEASASSTAASPQFKYIKFKGIENFRYFKFINIKSRYKIEVGMSEINAYK